MTTTTLPTNVAWTTACSPLSANTSMKPTISRALTASTIHSGAGITPAAPCRRVLRAASRSRRWSSHLAYAACWAAVRGSMPRSVRYSWIPQGFVSAISDPACMRGHSWWTTERA